MDRHATPGITCHMVGRYPENASHLPSACFFTARQRHFKAKLLPELILYLLV